MKNKQKTSSPVRAKKHLGQHFLRDENIARKIAETLSFEGYKHVLEIGPGTGVLTKYLLGHAHVTAMDLDTESIAYLENEFRTEHLGKAEKEHLTILEADFLKYNLSLLFGQEEFAVIGNFPYNISTQIVFKVLERKHQIPVFSGMFQKEVAQRICEKPGSKAYGILSVLTQAFYEVEYLFTVPPNVFSPPPKVDSGVMRMKRKANIQLACEEKMLFKVVKTAFQQRRKTLRNSLKSFGISDHLKEDPIFAQRPEQLGVDEFIGLTLKLEEDAVSNK